MLKDTRKRARLGRFSFQEMYPYFGRAMPRLDPNKFRSRPARSPRPRPGPWVQGSVVGGVAKSPQVIVPRQRMTALAWSCRTRNTLPWNRVSAPEWARTRYPQFKPPRNYSRFVGNLYLGIISGLPVIRPQSTASANVTKASGLLQGNCTSDSANVCGCRQGVTVLLRL
jgi:hypothetical protein